MTYPKEKFDDNIILEKGVSRRSVLKVIGSTIIISFLNIFPELGGVKKASATPLYGCSSGGQSYCCDIQPTLVSCLDGACYDVFLLEYRVDCSPIFGCTSCVGICRGPYYECSFFCYPPEAKCWMCPL